MLGAAAARGLDQGIGVGADASDEIARQGRIAGRYARADATAETLVRAATGNEAEAA